MCLFYEAYLDKKESDNSYHMIKKKEKKADLTKEFIKKVIKKVVYHNQSQKNKRYLSVKGICFWIGCLCSIIFLVYWHQQIYCIKENFHHMAMDCSLAQISAIDKEMKCFPVRKDPKKKEQYDFDNGYGGVRSYGGKRSHEGIDIMASNDRSGYFQIQSATDGVIEQIGWLRLGGYRLGIRSKSGFYYYYAHMRNYAPGIKKGKKVKAGTLLGTMGDTGYGKEGTHGKFAVHLHFGIYRDKKGEECSLNPYDVLLKLK